MKERLQLNIKESIWYGLRKITNNFSNLSVKTVENGYIKCLWDISRLDQFKIKLTKSCFYAIRLFDITNNRNINNVTCIMKEIQVSKFQSSISFPIPINKGVYYFEFGYRKLNGEWRRLASRNLNLGYRIKKVIHRFDKDTWFMTKNSKNNISYSPHEDAYQLSLPTRIGSSEKLFHE